MKLARRSLFQGIGAVLLARAALKFPMAAQVVTAAERALMPMRVFINGVEVAVGEATLRIDNKLVWSSKSKWVPQRSLHDDMIDAFEYYKGP